MTLYIYSDIYIHIYIYIYIYIYKYIYDSGGFHESEPAYKLCSPQPMVIQGLRNSLTIWGPYYMHTINMYVYIHILLGACLGLPLKRILHIQLVHPKNATELVTVSWII